MLEEGRRAREGDLRSRRERPDPVWHMNMDMAAPPPPFQPLCLHPSPSFPMISFLSELRWSRRMHVTWTIGEEGATERDE